MLKQFKMNSIMFDDQITLLKPLGYNLVSFYHENLKTLVIFHPALKTIVKSYKVKDINDYSFRDDRQYFYTYHDSYFLIYKTSDDGYYLLSEHTTRPIGFQWNYLLCMKDSWADSSSEDNFGLSSDISYDGNYNSFESSDDYQSESTSTKIELSLIKIERSQIYSKFHIKDSQEDKLSTLDKFYIIIQEETNESLDYQYYHVMIDNRPSIKFHVICDEIIDNNQLKHSNYYLSRVINEQEYLLINTKQQKNCKIIRKILLQDYNNYESLVYNYRQVLQQINPKQKKLIQLINLWNLQKINIKIDSFEKTILTKNNNMLVSSENNCLKFIKIQ